MKKHLYERDGVIHSALMVNIHRNIDIAYTKCGLNIPSDKSFKSEEDVSCNVCNNLEDVK